jgi:putative endonuclease
MVHSEWVPHWAESVARHHLEAQGYILLAQNYTTRRGEIDLVMRQGDTVVFVEVRQRSRIGFGTPAESIDARKRHRLRLAALHFLVYRCRDVEQPARFDAVLLTGGRAGFRLEHLEGIVD